MHAKWWCFHHGNSSGMNEKSMSVSTRVICFFVSTSTKCSSLFWWFAVNHSRSWPLLASQQRCIKSVLQVPRKVNNIASRAPGKSQEEVNNVASRAPGKSQEEVNNVASTASGKFQEEVSNAVSGASGKFQEEVSNAVSRASGKFQEEVNNVASWASCKFQEKLTT